MTIGAGKVDPENCPEPAFHNTGKCPFCTFNTGASGKHVAIVEGTPGEVLAHVYALVADLAEILAPYADGEVGEIDGTEDEETPA